MTSKKGRIVVMRPFFLSGALHVLFYPAIAEMELFAGLVFGKNEIYAENMDFLRNGTVIVSDPRDGIFIKCKDGILKVLEIQGENAKRMKIQDYLRGNPIEEFEVFE